MKIKRKTSIRPLTSLDVKILKFLWKWKLSNIMVLKYALASDRGFWKFYKILRQLYSEGYIKEVSHSANTMSFWTLTKKGFQYINDGSMGLTQARYQPQALLHDYWALVFQLGDFVFGSPSDVEIVSEQDFTAREPSDLPDWIPKSKKHIPDGFTRFEKDKTKKVVAFEIELSTKSDLRYEEMIRYLDQTEEIDWVFWLCENEKLIQKITHQITSVRRMRPTIHNFVLKSDVQERGWLAPFLWGELAGKAVCNLLGQQTSQHAVNTPVTRLQHKVMAVYLEIKKSPRQFSYLGSPVDPLGLRTPKGPGT